MQALIRRLADENGWGGRKIQAELEKLGFTVSLATVSRYLPKRTPDRGQQQRSLEPGRREILHFGVTANPTSPWVLQQPHESFPYDSSPRHLIYDKDSIFSTKLTEAIKNLGTEPKWTASTLGCETRPKRRPAEVRPSPGARVGGLPRIGGLHHRYIWQEAA